MLYMKDNIFIDTNIFIYAYLESPKKEKDYIKHVKAKKFLGDFKKQDNIIISTQVCNEYYSALLKNKIDNIDIQNSLNNLIKSVKVSSLSKNTVLASFHIKNQYSFSYWDSLILSSALENQCKILYTEDMQHNQIIENKLQVINPFF